jgi:hypothetical protein
MGEASERPQEGPADAVQSSGDGPSGLVGWLDGAASRFGLFDQCPDS